MPAPPIERGVLEAPPEWPVQFEFTEDWVA
jgi:hypothetical protein